MDLENKFGGGEDEQEVENLLDEEEFVEEELAAEDAPTYFAQPPVEAEVIGVRFSTSSKVYYFDPAGKSFPEGCHAVVETARGQEYGLVVQTNHVVSGREIVLPLRSALRVATAEDDKRNLDNRKKAEEAFLVGNKKIEEHKLAMKLIDTEYTFDNSKLLFYFTSEGRVDFRDLVKDLASVFRCRIELRQMGIRDEAKILGGLGICGRPFCCHAFLPDFVQVSIKMAKEQNLALNSAKISGACGRLMCCLRYEYDAYLEEGRLTPKVDSLVNTPDGIGVVVEAKPLVGLVKVKSLDENSGAPRVYHRDDLTPIKKGDDNYERASAEKSLEKQARAAGTTRAALKAAMNETPEKAAERAAREQRLARASREEPKKAASYTGQVTPIALQTKPEGAGDGNGGSGGNSGKGGAEIGGEQPKEKSRGRRGGRGRGRNRRGGGGGEAKEGQQNAPQGEQTKGQGEAPKNQRQPRYEKTSRGQKNDSQPKQENAPHRAPERDKQPAKPTDAGQAPEQKHRNRRPFHRHRGGKNNGQQ